MRTERYKYAMGVGGGGDGWAGAGRDFASGVEEMLFDLEMDPGELDDVSRDPGCAEALGEMRAELLRRWFEVEGQFPERTGAY